MCVIEGFSFISACEFRRLRQGPGDSPAVYGLFVRGADRILELARYFDHSTAMPMQIGEYGHLYTGCSAEAATRIKRHLVGDAHVSTFRKSMLAIEASCGAISRSGIGGWCGAMTPEAALSEWLATNALVGWQRCDHPFDEEASILDAWPSPLNIQGRASTSFARHLVELRVRTYGRLSDRRLPGPPPVPKRHTQLGTAFFGTAA
jgi:predicted GIY-YIG superfamily endonuclease